MKKLLFLLFFISVPCKAAINFTGANFVSTIGVVSSYSFIQNTGIFSITAWVKLSDNTTRHGFVGDCANASANKGFTFFYETVGGGVGSKALRLFCVRGTAGTCVFDVNTGSNTITDTNWHFIAFTSTAAVPSATTFYVDTMTIAGIQGTLTPSGVSSGDSTFPLYIGALAGTGPTLPAIAIIDDLRIYNRVLTTSEILSLYNSRSRILIGPDNCQTMKAWFPLNDGDYGTITGSVRDRSGCAATSGTLQNGPIWSGSPYINYP